MLSQNGELEDELGADEAELATQSEAIAALLAKNEEIKLEKVRAPPHSLDRKPNPYPMPPCHLTRTRTATPRSAALAPSP